jgi:hypothetical protein
MVVVAAEGGIDLYPEKKEDSENASCKRKVLRWNLFSAGVSPCWLDGS